MDTASASQRMYAWYPLRLARSNTLIYRCCAQDAKLLQKNPRKWIELGTQKSGMFFTTSTLKNLSTEYSEITEQYSRTQSGLVKEVVNIACMFYARPPSSLH